MDNIRKRAETKREMKVRLSRGPARHLRATPTVNLTEEYADLRRILLQTQGAKGQQLTPKESDLAVQRLIRYAIWAWKFLFVYWGWTAIMAAILLLLGNSLLSTLVVVGVFAIFFFIGKIQDHVLIAFLQLGVGIGSNLTAMNLPEPPKEERWFPDKL